MYKKLLFIFWMFLTGCAVGGFDITQPLVKIKPEAPGGHVEQVDWEGYVDEEIQLLPQTSHGCFFFYFKVPLLCPECDAMDETLRDSMTVGMLNAHFTSYKVTSDDPDWELAVQRFDIQEVPTIAIMSVEPHGLMVHHQGYLSPGALNDILSSALGDRCYYD